MTFANSIRSRAFQLTQLSDEDLFPITSSHQETLLDDDLFPIIPESHPKTILAEDFITPPNETSLESFQISDRTKFTPFKRKVIFYLQKELTLQASNFTNTFEVLSCDLSTDKIAGMTLSKKRTEERFPYPCELPANKDSLLWSFVFGHFFPNLENQDIINSKLDSMFGFGFSLSEGSNFKALLENFNLKTPRSLSLSEYIKDKIEDYIFDHLRSVDQKSFTDEEKQKLNGLIRNSRIECDFTSKLYLEALSSKFKIPIICIKENEEVESFGIEFTSNTKPVCIERLAKNSHEKTYQYIPRLIDPPQIDSLMSNEAAFRIVQKFGATKALKLYPHNEKIFKFSILKISEIFPGTKLFKTLNDNENDPYNDQLIGLFIAKVGAKKAIEMFPSHFQIAHSALTRAPELFQSLKIESQQDLRLASIYLNKFGKEKALKACPQSVAIKQLTTDTRPGN